LLDLFEEFASVVSALEKNGIGYAVCGGLALAAHGVVRATTDIDLLVLTPDLERAQNIVAELGFVILASPMKFSGGEVQIHRATKTDPDSEDYIPIDFMLVTPALNEIWRASVRILWERGEISVVSKEGLIALKSMRSSAQDLEDIRKLQEQMHGH